MYILKNAFISITRNKGRNLLIGIVILVISCSVAVTLAINNSSSNLMESYASKYETEATLGMNRENMMKDFDPSNREESKENMQDMFQKSNVTVEEIEKFADSNYVKSYYYTLSTGVNSNSLEKVSADTNKEEEGERFGGRFGGDFNKENTTSGDFTLKGYSSISSMNEFIEGTYTITDGEVSSDFDSNHCLVSKELATSNGLTVGDTIEMVDASNESYTYTLTVTGIYEEKESSSDDRMAMFTNSANTIITNTNVLKSMQEKNADLTIQTNPTFVLTSSDVVEKFEKELQEKELNENLKVETNLDQVENATSTISNVKNFAITFLVITLIIGTIVLLVTNMIHIRERRYEIGVLRTIGMKKSKVALQFFYELFIVSTIFLVLGAGIGAMVSVPVSNQLLKSEIAESQNDTNKISENFGFRGDRKEVGGQMPSRPENHKFNGVVEVQAFDSIDAVVDFKVLVELLIIGLFVTLLSGTSALISIQRFSPLTILKERT